VRSPRTHEIPEVPDEPGYILGGVILVLLITPQVYALISYEADRRSSYLFGPPFTAAYFALIGAVFLASYYFSHKSFLFRWFAWFCERGSFPATRKMAFFYFALCMLVAGIGVFHGSP